MSSVDVGLRGVAYALPRQWRSLGELHALGALQSEPALLEAFGFGRVAVAVDETPYSLALAAGRAVLEECVVSPASVDTLLYSGTPAVAFAPGGRASDPACRIATPRRFQYPATRLHYELGLEHAATIAVDQLACTSLFGAVRLARALIQSGDAERVLCVSAEFFPDAEGREAIYNCTADAACAVIVERGAERNRIVASSHVTKGYYWEGEAMKNEVVASYFPTGRHVIAHTLRRAGWTADDVRWVIPHNVSVRSWDILLGLAGIPRDRLWSRNVARIGHTLAGDNFINLRDAMDEGSIQPGDRLLLFAYGYGAHWTGLALEA